MSEGSLRFSNPLEQTYEPALGQLSHTLLQIEAQLKNEVQKKDVTLAELTDLEKRIQGFLNEPWYKKLTLMRNNVNETAKFKQELEDIIVRLQNHDSVIDTTRLHMRKLISNFRGYWLPHLNS